MSINKTQWVAFFIGLFILFLGLSPMFASIMNAGTAGILFFGASLSALSLLWNAPFFKRTKPVSGNRDVFECAVWWRRLRMFFTAILALCVATGIALSVPMLQSIWNSPDNDITYTVVVLGCQTKNGQPSLMLQRRLDSAIVYLNEHANAPVVVSGGGEDDNENEAAVMRRYLLQNGIENARIYEEKKSRNTRENLTFSVEIIKEQGLPEAVAIASDGFHVFRGSIYAKKNGITTIATLPSKTSLGILPVFWVREWFGICKALFLE